FVIGYVGLLIYSLFDIKEGKEDIMIEDVNQELGLELPRIVDLIKVSTTSFTRHFLAILRHVTGEDSNHSDKSSDELDDAFHRALSSKRYLVLVDEKIECLVEKVAPQYPPLEKVGQRIAKKCGGLPLSIVLVAGILANMEKKKGSCKQESTTLDSCIHNDSKAIIEQSYKDLLCHLKP
ncbi:hypothetical protein MTR67_017846, partial [Solanum verrucosum]